MSAWPSHVHFRMKDSMYHIHKYWNPLEPTAMPSPSGLNEMQVIAPLASFNSLALISKKV